MCIFVIQIYLEEAGEAPGGGGWGEEDGGVEGEEEDLVGLPKKEERERERGGVGWVG